MFHNLQARSVFESLILSNRVKMAASGQFVLVDTLT